MHILKLSYRDSDGVLREGEFFSGFGMAYRTNYEIFEPILETQLNSVGYFSFTIYPSHPLYDFIDQPKNLLEIVRYNVDEPLFIGRMAECRKGLYNEKNLTFESELAFLLDSVRTNFASDVGYSTAYWLDEILRFHNTHAGNFGDIYQTYIGRKFERGNVSESISPLIIQPNAEEFKGTFSTLEIIQKLLLEKCGGLLKIRHEDGVNYIDWLDEEDLHVSSQKIELSKNLISLEQNRVADEIVTAIRPIGDNVTTTGEPLDITLTDASIYLSGDDIFQIIDSTVSETSDLRFTDTLYSKSLVDKYGWIQREVLFEGVTNVSSLFKKAEQYLLGISENQTITINAVDLANSDNSLENFSAGEVVMVNSPVHFLGERKMSVYSVRLDLSDPTACEITLGNQSETITSQAVRGGSSTAPGVSYSGSGGGNYDPEGSAEAALKSAKEYTDTVAENKVDKQDGKGLSANDFTGDYKNQIDTNTADISKVSTSVTNIGNEVTSQGSRITTLEQETSGHLSTIDSQIEDLQSDISTIGTNAADALKTAITANTNANTALNGLENKLDSTGSGYVPIRYVTESADFNTDFMLTANDPNKVIFSCPQKIQSANAPFGSVYLPYILIAERIYATTVTQVDFIRYTCMAVEYAGTEQANVLEYQRYYKGSANPIWTEWENISQSSGTGETVTVDSQLSTTSENPVQNKVITEKIDDIQTELSQTTSKATDVYKAMPTINGYFSDLRNDVAINRTSLGMQKKNLLKLKHLPGYSYTNTSNSVTWTFNDDYSVTMSTTAIISSGQSFEIASVTLSPGTYIYSVEGCPTTSVIHTQLYLNDSWNANLSAVENTITVTEEGIYSFRFYRNSAVSSGTSVTLFPMLRYADVTDSTFEPYTESVQEQIKDIQTELSQTTSKATDVYKAMPTINGNISSLQSEVDGLTASVDYMSKYKADTTTVNGVISNVSTLTSQVNTNTDNIEDIQTELAQTTSKATDVYKAMPTINGYISDLQSEVDGLTASVDYMAQYKAETATVNGVISNVSSLSTRVSANEDDISCLVRKPNYSSKTTIKSLSKSSSAYTGTYTATADCYLNIFMAGSSTTASSWGYGRILVNSTVICSVTSNGAGLGNSVFIPSGTTVTYTLSPHNQNSIYLYKISCV